MINPFDLLTNLDAVRAELKAAQDRIAELEKDRARLELERNCAVGVLLMAPQAPATNQYCPDWVDSYRVWWIRRLPGTGELLDAAMNQTAQGEVKPIEVCACHYPDFWGGHKFCGHCGKPGEEPEMREREHKEIARLRVRAENAEALFANAANLDDCEEIRSRDRELERMRAALEPFANCVFNDNGDLTIDESHLHGGDWLRAYRALNPQPAQPEKP